MFSLSSDARLHSLVVLLISFVVVAKEVRIHIKVSQIQNKMSYITQLTLQDW